MKKVTRFLFKVLYIIAGLLAILFVVLIGITYFRYKVLLKNPLIEMAPYTIILKELCKIFLIPAVISAALGFIIQRYAQR